MWDNQVLARGKEIIAKESEVLRLVSERLDGNFIQMVRAINNCTGKVVFVGMGKPGRVNAKVAATFCSLGIPAYVLHPGEAMHGDLGILQKDDLVVVISYSGESDEVTPILPLLERYSSGIIGVTGNPDSTLARMSRIVYVFPKFEEADPLGLAPTTSTTAWIALADALAVVVSSGRGFTDEDFGSYHPAGSLGKKVLLSVDELMVADRANATVLVGSKLTSAIVEIGRKGIGMTCVLDEDSRLAGIITDGDLRRQLMRGADVYSMTVDAAMTRAPYVIESGAKAIYALQAMRKNDVSCLPVLKGEVVAGTVLLKTIVDAGIVA